MTAAALTTPSFEHTGFDGKKLFTPRDCTELFIKCVK